MCDGALRPGASPPAPRRNNVACVGHIEREGMKEHKQDRNEDRGRQDGTKKTGEKKSEAMWRW